MATPARRRSSRIAAVALLCLLALGLWEACYRLAAGPRPAGAEGSPLPVSAPPLDSRSWERWTYIPVAADPSAGPTLSARAAILVEPTTMTVLYARNEHERRAPASTTKI